MTFPRQRQIPTISTRYTYLLPICSFLTGFYVMVAIFEAQVRKELAEEEERHLAAGGISPHNTSAASFLALRLEIEETQCIPHRPSICT